MYFIYNINTWVFVSVYLHVICNEKNGYEFEREQGEVPRRDWKKERKQKMMSQT